ncbi:MAG: hypothetical protein AABX89_02130 [Candidatus Thermoplasmatota archaeon]
MGKTLPILGIAAAVLAAAFACAVTGDAVPLLAMLFLVGVAIALFVQARALPVLLGVGLLLAAASAILYYAPFIGEGGKVYLAGMPDFFQGPYQAALCVLAWVAILVARQEEVEPTWMLAIGPIFAGIAILAMLFIPSSQFGNFGNSVNIIAGVLCLTLIVPMAFLLRGPREEPEPAPSPFQPVRPVPPGLRPAPPVKAAPTFAAPLKKAPAPAPPPPGQTTANRSPPK